MEINYKNTLDDITAFARYHFDHSNTVKQTIQRTRLLSSIIMIIILGLISWIAESYTYLLVGVPVAIIYFIQFPNMMRKIGINSVKRSYMEGRNKGLFEQRKISLTPEKIIITSEYGESTINWNTIETIQENDRYIFIYLTTISALIIPKHSLDSTLAADFMNQAVQFYEDANKNGA